MDWKWFTILMGVVAALILLLSFITPVSAATNGSFEIFSITPQPTLTPIVHDVTGNALPNLTGRVPLNNNTRISQGQCVEMGGVYDISGIGWWTGSIAYHGAYTDDFAPGNETLVTLKEQPYSISALRQFFIDPLYFKDYPGFWYVHYPNLKEKAANNRLFYVSANCTRGNKTTTIQQEEQRLLLNPYSMDVRYSDGLALSNDDPLFMLENGTKQLWLFGDDEKILSKDVNLTPDVPVFEKELVETWSVGFYNLLLVTPGVNGIYELKYQFNNRSSFDKDTLVPTMRGLDVIDVTGFQPRMIQDRVETMLKENTDDQYQKYKINLQDPYVEITGYQEVRLGNLSYGNISLLEVTGYTNKIPGTPITLVIDVDPRTQRSGINYPTMTITSEGNNLSEYRTFHGYYNLDYNILAPGHHELTAILPSGKIASVGFYIREETQDFYTKPTYYKFIDGNPFIPIPTPVIVEKEVIREVIKTVTVEKIVKDPVDYDKLAQTEIDKVLPIVGAVFAIGIPMIYIVYVAIRAFAERRIRNKTKEIKL